MTQCWTARGIMKGMAIGKSAPMWWLVWNNVVEPELMINCKSNIDACRKFKASVKQSLESGEYISTHQMYLDRISERN